MSFGKKRIGAFVLFAALFATVMSVSGPAADAQTTPEFAAPRGASAGNCPAGYSDRGPVTDLPGTSNLCTPDGYGRMVSSVASCARASMDVPGAHIVTHNNEPLCILVAFPLPSGATRCNAVFVQGRDSAGVEFCLIPVFSNGGSSGDAPTPACIESDLVQNAPLAASAGVGNTFFDAKGNLYLIATGAPSCEFNCYRGFDANCDGKLGDYCSVELDLTKVDDVGKCLAALAAKP